MGSFRGTGGVFSPPIAYTDQINTFTALQYFGGGLNLPLGQRFEFGDADCWLYEQADDNVRLMMNGLHNMTWNNAGNTTNRHFNLNSYNLQNIAIAQFDEIALPGALANHGFVYCRDIAGVAEVMGMDDGGAESQLTSHKGLLNKYKKFVHKTTFPDGHITEIDIQKFFEDNYPQYINQSKPVKIPIKKIGKLKKLMNWIKALIIK